MAADNPEPLVAPHIERLQAYVPGMPLEELKRRFGIADAIKLASNESPFGPSPRALEAAQAALADVHRYPDQRALREAIAAHHGVPINEVILGGGSDELISLAVRTFARPGDVSVYCAPSFPTYAIATSAMALDARVVPLRDHVAYDVTAIIAALAPDTRFFFLANPNNPTGAHVGRADLSRILQALPDHAIAVIDEAYVEFADVPDFASALALRELHARTLVLRTFSKAYGLAGFRVGYGIAPSALIGYLDRVRPPFNVSSLGLAAAEAGLSDQAHVQRYVAHNASERARVRDALVEHGCDVAPSQANFLLLRAPAARFSLTGRALVDALLRRGVITRPMPPPIDDWLRVTIGTETENDRLLATMRELLEPRGT